MVDTEAHSPSSHKVVPRPVRSSFIWQTRNKMKKKNKPPTYQTTLSHLHPPTCLPAHPLSPTYNLPPAFQPTPLSPTYTLPPAFQPTPLSPTDIGSVISDHVLVVVHTGKRNTAIVKLGYHEEPLQVVEEGPEKREVCEGCWCKGRVGVLM